MATLRRLHGFLPTYSDGVAFLHRGWAWRDATPEAAMMNATPPRRDQERNPGRIDPDLAVEDAPGDRVPGEDLNQRQEKLIDEAIEETYPASDPIAPKRRWCMDTPTH
jgi:hypothetical protein